MNQITDQIGVFDSGLGGLSVLRELRSLMPNENFVYLGDSRNAPYGGRSCDEIQNLTLTAVQALMANGLKALVIACNTATSAAIDLLRETYPQLIVVGIEPALRVAARRHPKGRIGVMATTATLRETKFSHLMRQYQGDCTVLSLPCPGVVELIEAGVLKGPQMESLLRTLLAPAIAPPADAMVLGCTHYPFIRQLVQQLLGPNTEILDGGPGTARETRRRLDAAGLLQTDGPGSVELHNSLGTPEILRLSRMLLELP